MLRSTNLILAVSLIVAGCGGFSPAKPFPCSTAGHCPSGFTCDLTSRLCYANGQTPDGGGGARDGEGGADIGSDRPSLDAREDEASDLGDAGDFGDLSGATDTTLPDVSVEAPVDRPPADVGGSETTKTTNGGACVQGSDCASTFCVDRVCCDKACNGTCMACTSALTGQASGQCALVKAGTNHGSDCTADGSTCGQDGKCDGKGGCSFSAAGTVCKGESCLAGTSMHSPMSTCDGKGACVAMMGDCGNYTCDTNGVRCRAGCTGSADCIAAAFCGAGGFCLPDLPPGSICTNGDQCMSALCGGRCCPDRSMCVCTQPSVKNLLMDPGFDSDFSGWKSDGVVTFAKNTDVEHCPYSGSVRVENGHLSQCVKVNSATKYNFGISYMRTAADAQGTVDCAVYFYDDFACSGNLIANGSGYLQDDTNQGVVPWTSINTSVTPSSGAASANIICETGGAAYLDKFFLSPDPAMY